MTPNPVEFGRLKLWLVPINGALIAYQNLDATMNERLPWPVNLVLAMALGASYAMEKYLTRAPKDENAEQSS